MDLSNKFLQLPAAVIASYVEDAQRVLIQGNLKMGAFEREHRQTIRSPGLSAQKAVYLATQIPPKPLRSIQDSLK